MTTPPTYPPMLSVEDPEVQALAAAIADLYGTTTTAPFLYRPTVSVLGEDATPEQAVEAIRRTDRDLWMPHASYPEDYHGGRTRPDEVFARGLADLVRAPGKRMSEESKYFLRRIKSWWRGWGTVHLSGPICDFVCPDNQDQRYGWITPAGKVSYVADAQANWYDLANLALDAISLARAFPWLTCVLAVYSQDERAEGDYIKDCAGAVRIERGEAKPVKVASTPAEALAYLSTCQQRFSEAIKPYAYDINDFFKDSDPTPPHEHPAKLTRCQWSLAELEVLWADAIAGVDASMEAELARELEAEGPGYEEPTNG